jgi:hypothetical protein
MPAMMYVERPSILPNDVFIRQLQIFGRCAHEPTGDHPAITRISHGVNRMTMVSQTPETRSSTSRLPCQYKQQLPPQPGVSGLTADV